MGFELALYAVVCNGIGSHCLGHAAIRIGFPYWTNKAILVHKPTNLLMIHSDPNVQQPHMYSTYTFVVAAEFEGFDDQLKVLPILDFAFGTLVTVPEPVVIAGSGDPGDRTQVLDGESIICLLKEF